MGTRALMRSTTSNGVIKSKADTLPDGPSRIFTYATPSRTNKAGSHPPGPGIMKLSETQTREYVAISSTATCRENKHTVYFE